MKSKKNKTTNLTKIQNIIKALERVPKVSKKGFFSIGEHIGNFSGGFAKSATEANLIQDRIKNGNDMGLGDLRTTLDKVYNEIDNSTREMNSLIERKAEFNQNMKEILTWSYTLEQDAFLPPTVDQLKGDTGKHLEAQTIGSIVDSLLLQSHPLTHEIVTVTQHASGTMNNLTLRITTDLESSIAALKAYKRTISTAAKRMLSSTKNISKACDDAESRSNKVNGIVFEIIGAIQYDDINTQRIQHAVEILLKVEERYDKLETDRDKLWFITALRITADQLKECLKDFHNAFKTIQGNFNKILENAVEQIKAINNLRETQRQLLQDTEEIKYNLTTILGLSFFNDSLTSEVMRSLSQAENNIYQAQKAISMLTMTTERLEQLVTTLKTFSNNRLKALSEMIDEYSKRINKEAPDKQKLLSGTYELLTEINLDYSDKVTPQIIRTGSMLRRVPLSTQRMETNIEDLSRSLNNIMANTQAIAIQVKLLVSETRFGEEIQNMLEKVIKRLEEIVKKESKKQADAGDKKTDELTEEFEDLKDFYTMASERNIHQAAVGEDSDAEESFGDIELF